MSRTLLLIVLVGLAIAHVLSSIGDALIGKGAAKLDRDALDRVRTREGRTNGIWKTGESLAVMIMLAGLLKAWAIIPGREPWGIPAVAFGFGLFCLASIVRAWLRRAAYAAEAPGSDATRGALIAGLLTTAAECLVGVAVCGYIYTHMTHTKSTPGVTESATDTSTDTATDPEEKKWIGESEALALLPGKDAKYLKAMVDERYVRARSKNNAQLYMKEDIDKYLNLGLPTPEDLKLGLEKPSDEKPQDKDRVKE